MTEHGWKTRLEAAIRDAWIARGGSMAELSAKLSKGPNYISQMLKDDKAPRVDAVLGIAEVIGVSASSIILGIEMTAEDEKLLLLASKLDQDRKRTLLDLLNSLASESGSRP